MNIATVTTTSGYQWRTEINGDLDSVSDYFLGKMFNTASFPDEKMEKAIEVEMYDNDGGFMGTRLLHRQSLVHSLARMSRIDCEETQARFELDASTKASIYLLSLRGGPDGLADHVRKY